VSVSRKRVVLVTGANGEMGRGLIRRLAERSAEYAIVGLDIQELDESLGKYCHSKIVGDVLDDRLLERLVSEYEIHSILHLAALLSTRAEFTPETAHAVNVGGTLNLLKLAVEQSRWHGRPVQFLLPSSIAVYGLPNLETKAKFNRISEHQWNVPSTMYGCNKLYAEHLGRYYSRHYRQLAVEEDKHGVDFRSIRFPGLISAFTVPHGGTSDYGPEMIHSAAQNSDYACFVREDTRIPFMAMPDAIDAIVQLMEAPVSTIEQSVYNISSYNPSAGDFYTRIRQAFPQCRVEFEPDIRRQAIVDSWPEDVDDSRARKEWGYSPVFDFERTFEEYLLPNIKKLYRQ
jgi:threonine 3-dehydrogenase